MADLLEISRRVIDEGERTEQVGPINRIIHKLSEINDDIAIVEAFSHVVLLKTDAGFVAVDASGAASGDRVLQEIRRYSQDPIAALIYTHGHVDHIGGSGYFRADAERHNRPYPTVLAHEMVPERVARYRKTNGYNLHINARQFQGFGRRGYGIGGMQKFVPDDYLDPTVTYSDKLAYKVGDLALTLNHNKGETDDHTWVWIEESRTICAGDFFIWNFPNCGNPSKAQRYAVEWVQALREMIAKDAELFIPAHGLPIAGRDRINKVLADVADTLESVVTRTLDMMNEGATLDDIVHTVKVPPEQLEKPWLNPNYDEPDFVIRGVWKRYGGWYEGDPAYLKPSPKSAIAAEIVALAGLDALVTRATDLAESGEVSLACHMIELAFQHQPDNLRVHEARASIYQKRRDGASSLMAKGVYGTASNESKTATERLHNH